MMIIRLRVGHHPTHREGNVQSVTVAFRCGFFGLFRRKAIGLRYVSPKTKSRLLLIVTVTDPFFLQLCHPLSDHIRLTQTPKH